MLREAKGLVCLDLAARRGGEWICSLTTKSVDVRSRFGGYMARGTGQNGGAKSYGMTWIRITTLDSIILREFWCNPLILNNRRKNFSITRQRCNKAATCCTYVHSGRRTSLANLCSCCAHQRQTFTNPLGEIWCVAGGLRGGIDMGTLAEFVKGRCRGQKACSVQSAIGVAVQ